MGARAGRGELACGPRLAPLRLRSGQAVGCNLLPLRGWTRGRNQRWRTGVSALHGQVHRSFAALRMTRDIWQSRFLVAALARNDKVVGVFKHASRELLIKPVLVAGGMGSFDLGFIRGANESRR